MNDDETILPDIETMVIPATAAPWAAESAAAPQAATSQGARSDDSTASEPSVGVCAPASTIPETPPLGVQATPAASIETEPVKLNGREHPWKPRTPAQVAEFTELWRDLALPVAAIAKRYQAGERTVQNWRKEFGLPGRDELARVQDLAASKNSSMLLAPKAPPAPTTSPTPGHVAAGPSNPLEVPEIAALLHEIGDEARRITPSSDLRPLRRKFQKLAALTTASAPHNWASLHALAQEQGRALVWAEHCEAKLPKPEVDAQQLRKDAANQLMRELRSVLDPDEQQRLAVLVQAAADRLMARARNATGTTGPLS